MRKSSHHELGSAILVLESLRSLFGDIAILSLDRTDLDIVFYGSKSSMCGNLHSANKNSASILPRDRPDMV